MPQEQLVQYASASVLPASAPFYGCLRFFRFNHRLLASWTRSGRTFSGLRFRRVTRCIAIANRRDRRGFSRQRGIDRHIVQLLLILWLGQRIVQVTLHFNTLLTIRCRRGLPLSRRRRDRRQRYILLSIFRRRGSRRWLHAIRLIGRIASKINTLLARRSLIAGRGRGAFSAEPIPIINSRRTRMPTPIIIY